jgi:hypothetical protein
MLGVAIYTTIKTLWERTKNKTEIARLTGHYWKTVAKVIKNIEAGIEIEELLEGLFNFTTAWENDSY